MKKTLILALALAAPVAAQTPDERAALAVADSALAAINRGDMAVMAELMVPEAFVMAIRDSTRYFASTRDAVRTQQIRGVVERGFRPVVHVSGPLAMVWLPYDLYVNGAWSHCGIDAFLLVKADTSWKIASLAYTIEQPPACEPHPDGPPPGPGN